MHPAIIVFIYGSITALATGLGTVPFAFVRSVSQRAVAYANAVAAGLMLGASFGLVAEGTDYGSWQTVAGATIGVLLVLITQRVLHKQDIQLGSLSGPGARRVFLMVIVMTIHSFAEGIAVGAAFAGGISLALLITIAIAVHNVPEGLAITAALRPKGVTLLACAGWSIFSSLPQPLMAVPTFLFVDAFTPALPFGLGVAAGAMVFMVLVELLPEAYDNARKPVIGLLVGVTLIGMILFQKFL